MRTVCFMEAPSMRTTAPCPYTRGVRRAMTLLPSIRMAKSLPLSPARGPRQVPTSFLQSMAYFSSGIVMWASSLPVFSSME
ncbi:hypothetical protein ADK54_05345 [Streptomyces sp. WM6378]|nr:hypothetical protein ADK54_05345 [Streptomyces sp. WM6378]